MRRVGERDREAAARRVLEDEDASAEAERDDERGAEDAAPLALLDVNFLGLGDLGEGLTSGDCGTRGRRWSCAMPEAVMNELND